MAKKTKRGAGAPKREKKHAEQKRALKRASTSDLEAELDRRRRTASTLQRKRAQLEKAIQEIDQELAALGLTVDTTPGVGGGTPGTTKSGTKKRRAPRGGNTKTLLSHLEEVLDGRVLSVSEAADAVMANGYRSTSKTFRPRRNSIAPNPGCPV